MSVGRRDLRSLPKCHLHLHFGQATIRRRTLDEWIANLQRDDDNGAGRRQLEAMQADALAAKNDKPQHAAKYDRRFAMVTPPLDTARMVGPLIDGPEALEAMNDESPQPGDGPVWDAQWVCRHLIEHHPDGPEAAEARILHELADDAVEEGIRWVELCQGVSIVAGSDDGSSSATIDDKERARWLNRLQVAKDATERTGVGFGWVVAVPETAKKGVTAGDLLSVLASLDPPGRATGAFVGVGQWGTETSAAEHAEAYAELAAAGLPGIVVHAGEHHLQAHKAANDYDGPGNVRAAVAAGARRVGHGIEAAKDLELCRELVARGDVCLEVCPISNLRLGYVQGNSGEQQQGLKAHPLLTLLVCGVPCCLNADDPTLFGSKSSHGLVREYEACRQIIGLTDEQLAQCARDSFRHSRAPQNVKDDGEKAIDEWLAVRPIASELERD